MKKLALLLAALSVASVSYAKEVVPEPVVEEVVVEEPSKSYVVTDKGLFYIANDYQELKALPSFSINAPAGLVPGSGIAFVGISGTRNSHDTDGGFGFGVGYGNPYESLGGAISLSVGSVDPRDGGSFDRGNINVSAGHIFSEYGLGISVGSSNIDLWHNDSKNKLDPSYYLSATKLLPNEIAPITITVGAGNNMYAKTDEKGNKNHKVYPFISAAAYILPQLSIIVDYTSDITSAGFGIVPSPKLPVSLILGAYDITDETSFGTSFMAGLSAAYTF